MKKLIIIGASGHGKVIADIAVNIGYKDIFFLDDDLGLKECAGFPVIGQTSMSTQIDGDKIVAIGNSEIRQRMMREIKTVSLIHPKAIISRRVKIGEGTVIMAGAIINSDVVIGKGCIINTGSSIDHDCVIKDYVHVSVGSHISGTCIIGEKNWIGAGAIITNNVSICSNCIIGAGAVVIKNINDCGTYVGVPTKKIK